MGVPVERTTARSQLDRLATLTDVVYAVGLVLVVQWLPIPQESLREGKVWLLQLYMDHPEHIVGSLIGLAFVIIYWLRSNTLLTVLDRTDGAHTAFSIGSVFFLLFLLYIVRVGNELADSSRRAGESVAVALVGLSAAAAWWHASRKGLVRSGTSDKERTGVQIEAFAEPLAAVITLPFAFVGELAWNLAWLAYIPVARLLRRRGVK